MWVGGCCKLFVRKQKQIDNHIILSNEDSLLLERFPDTFELCQVELGSNVEGEMFVSLMCSERRCRPKGCTI